MDFSLDEIRPTYRFNETCQENCAEQAIIRLSGISGFEDAVPHNAISASTENS